MVQHQADQNAFALPDRNRTPMPDDVGAQLVTRDVTDADIEPLADFLVFCFGRWPEMEITCTPAEHVVWKMTPHGKIPEEMKRQYLTTLADDPTAIIAAQIRVGHRLWLSGTERVLNQGGDAAVHPDWRMLNVRQTLRNYRNEHGLRVQELSLNWLAQHPATRKGGLERPEVENRVRVFWRPGGVERLLAVPHKNRGVRFTAGTAVDAIRRRVARREPAFAGSIVDLERFDERTDAIWEAAKGEFQLAFVRDHQRQNWRYLDPRAGRFRARAAFEGDQLIGYAVMKPYSDPASIVDILVQPGRLDAVDGLIADAVERIDRIRPDGSSGDIQCWLPGHHPYVSALRARGFLDSGQDPSLRFRSFTVPEDELRFLLDPRAPIHITHGDSDFV